MKNKKIIYLILIGFLVIVIIALAYYFYNNSKDKKLLQLVKGTWIADGTQQNPIIAVDGGKVTYAIDPNDMKPYYLIFDGKGKYSLTLTDKKYSGTYTITADNQVSISSKELNDIYCQLKNDDIELHCDRIADMFVKK